MCRALSKAYIRDGYKGWDVEIKLPEKTLDELSAELEAEIMCIDYSYIPKGDINEEKQIWWTSIVSVQPLSAPSGHVFFLDYSHNDKKDEK